MINGQSVLAIIPARGGSKRCPGKNLRLFRGKSLIEWAYEAARASKYIDHVYCSTEDAEIKAHALAIGCLVIDRPAELANDTAMNEDVLRHALELRPHDWVVLLQPTSPLRTAHDIDQCIKMAQAFNPCISFDEDGKKNGVCYVASAKFLRDGRYFDTTSINYTMANARSLDIDYPEQFECQS